MALSIFHLGTQSEIFPEALKIHITFTFTEIPSFDLLNFTVVIRLDPHLYLTHFPRPLPSRL